MTSFSPKSVATALVVDDIAANRNVLGETLEKENYEVLLAPDGTTASRFARKRSPTSFFSM